MFKNQPKGLFALALANTGERFGYYTMLAIFTLFMQAKFGWDESTAGQVNAIFLAVVYFAPLFGGMIADKIGYGRCVVAGFVVMFLGYLGLAIPTAPDISGQVAMFAGLAAVSLGTGLFKGNLQVLIGNLYDDPKYASRRDSAFSLFYMAINMGAMFAPSMANWITEKHLAQYGFHYDAANHAPEYLEALYSGYGLCFGVACVSLILSAVIYFATRNWFKHADVNAKQAASKGSAETVELTPKQTKDRIVALCLVFAVVIFFWMAFHQNGQSLTWFARDYTQAYAEGWCRIGFNIWALALIAVSVYTLFATFQSEKTSGKLVSGVVTAGLWLGAFAIFKGLDNPLEIFPQLFQQFNPFFVVALTPISMALFSALAAKKTERHPKGLEPSAPKKIGIGMFVAALGYLIMIIASKGQMSPAELQGTVSPDPVIPQYLMATYLVLTFAELLLSPMGISFVTKVAPPKYKGLMMGLWFAATAIGNYLSSIPGLLWEKVPLWANWAILMALCVIAGSIMFAMLKKIEAATAE